VIVSRSGSSSGHGKGDAGKNGLVRHDQDAARSWGKVAAVLGDLAPRSEQLAVFPDLPATDAEPWDVLMGLLAVDETAGLQKLAQRTGLTYMAEPRLAESSIRFYEVVPPSMARQHQMAGLSSDGVTITVATSQPMQPAMFSYLEERIGMPVRMVLSPRGAVTNLINRGYEQRQDLVTEIVEELPLDQRAIESAAGSIRESNDLLQLARQGPVIRLVNMILFEALRRRASDIHVHPMESKLVIRFRIDGMLIDVFSPPLALASAISSRLKVMTELDIANRHSPQDGHTSVRVGNRKIDIRFSCVPTVYGERLVLRLLDQTSTNLSLDQIGMGSEHQQTLMSMIDRPTGIILVTGPTGSGKTTTLYGALSKVDRSSRNVMTIEDPVEYHLDGISQTQVNVKRGVTFAAGLRSLLRQDPDVILVGEIRDAETAKLAVQASLTGHLVLATLHTNDAPSAVARLLDIGIEPYLVTSTLLAVVAQRLARRTCGECKGMGQTISSGSVRGPCEKCFGTTYHGRVGLFEIMEMTDDLRQLTAVRADSVKLYHAAIANGFQTMRDDGLKKIAKGMTTEAELRRVLG
jgi:general secretion pathway protein E